MQRPRPRFPPAVRRAALALGLGLCVGGPVTAQDRDPYADLPAITRPGTVAADGLVDGMAWLAVDQDGIYRVALDGPGLLALAAFATPDGRPAPNTRPGELRRDGGWQVAGVLDHLLLERGRRYLLMARPMAGPAGVTVTLTAPLPTTAPPDDGPLTLAAGQRLILRPDGGRAVLDLDGPADAPLHIRALSAPDADVGVSLGTLPVGPGGVFPRVFPRTARLDIRVRPRADDTVSPVVLDIAADATGTTEIEPNHSREDGAPQDVGAIADIGARFTGTLLAPMDADALDFTLDRARVLSISAVLDGPVSGAQMTLDRIDGARAVPLLQADARDGRIARDDLDLGAGRYRLTLGGRVDRPAGWTVDLRPGTRAAPGHGAEPDDTADGARDLAAGQALRGTLGPGDVDAVRLLVPEPGRLWDLRAVPGVRGLDLRDGAGTAVGNWGAADGAMVLRLALAPGPHLARLTGDGPYAIRLTDLGPVPAGFEVEPNDADATAARLVPGDRVQGDFHAHGDRDRFLIDLSVPTPLTLTLTPPDDGTLAAELSIDGVGRSTARVAPADAPHAYTATFPAGQHRLDLTPGDDGMSGRWTLALDRAEAATEAEPDGVRALPGDGRIGARIGQFDTLDRVFVPLPQGAGAAAMMCSGGFGRWAVQTYGDDRTLVSGRPGQWAVMDYAPDLGGGVEWRIDSAGPDARYDCRLRVLPDPADGDVGPAVAHDDAQGLVRPGTVLRGRFDDAADRDDVALDLAPGALAAWRCGPDAPGADAFGDRTLRAADPAFGDSLAAPATASGLRVVAGLDGVVPTLTLAPPRGADLPMGWRCDIHADAAFRDPAAAGPPAPFTAPQIRAPADRGDAGVPYDPAAALAVLSGGRADWLTPHADRGDLPVTLDVGGLDHPARAFSRQGQRLDGRLRVTNAADTARTVTVDLSVLAQGWRVTPPAARLTLAPGADEAVAFAVDIPPFQGPALTPALHVRAADADGQSRAVTVPLSLSADAPDRGGHRFWSVPGGLRGGLDPLLAQLGARVTRMDGAAVDDARAAAMAPLHDGQALHADIDRWLDARVVDFALAAPAPVAGLRVHLRTRQDRADWPAGIALDLSADGRTWTPALSVALGAGDAPQVFALPAPVTANHARIRVDGCRGGPCGRVALADVGLIAAPGWRPPGAIDIARPDLGGHVIAAMDVGGGKDRGGPSPFGCCWNRDLLSAGTPLRLGRGDDAGTARAIIGFHENRAARIARIGWIGDAADDADDARVPGARLAVSLAGPAGPWRDIGVLPAPDAGADAAWLDLPAPVWARALRVDFDRDARDPRQLPDRIAVIEDPAAPSILGLYEDDRPDAGYEDTAAPPAIPVPPPAGGPDADRAQPLATGQTVASSVQLERNEDWWRVDLPPGPARRLTLTFAGAAAPEFTWTLAAPDGAAVPLDVARDPGGDLVVTAVVGPGAHLLGIAEPPRSIVILWDTSASVRDYIPRTLAAVRVWAQSLRPGRDMLQLLPFGANGLLLDDWASAPEQVYPALATLSVRDSSDAETALAIAADALAGRDGARGAVIITDAETSADPALWGALLRAMPRVVALSIDSSTPRSVQIMKDWAGVNGGHFHRVTGQSGLADGLDLAAALFRAPKPYRLTVTTQDLREPAGRASIAITAAGAGPGPGPAPAPTPTGGIEVILDASGSMLQRMADGQRRIAVAQNALATLVRDTLPRGTPFAMRAFGLEVDACRSDLVVPFGPLDPVQAQAAIRAVPAVNLARTAIADSLARAADDLAALDPPRVLVLVTDGDETCGGDVGAQIDRMAARGLDLRLTIVGFAIDDADLARRFAGWAQAGGGQYLDAGDQPALNRAIADAIAPRFAVDRLYLDGRVDTVAHLGPGDRVEVAAGRYRLRPLQTAAGPARELDAADGDTVTMTYDAATGLAAPNGEGTDR